MKEIDWNIIQNAWKNEQGFQEKKLKEDDIQRFMQSSSKSLGAAFGRSIIMDIVLKGILWMAVLILLILLFTQTTWLVINFLLILLITTGIIYQLSIFKKIPRQGISQQTTKTLLKNQISFYSNRMIKSILVSAVSSSLLFIIGSMHYLYFKYGVIRNFEFDDFIVLGIGIVLSFGLSAWAQLIQNGAHMNELQSILAAIDENSIDENNLIRYKNNRRRNIVMVSIILLTGLILLMWFIFHS